MSISITPNNTASQIDTYLGTNGFHEQQGSVIASRLAESEHQMVSLYSVATPASAEEAKALVKNMYPNKSDAEIEKMLGSKWEQNFEGLLEGARKRAESRYQRAMRSFQAFEQLLRNMHEMLMTAIRNLRVN